MAGDAAPLLVVGLSHHTAPVHVRERLAVSEESAPAELAALRSSGVAREVFVLSTCNRVELFVVPGERGEEGLREYLRRKAAGQPLDEHLYWFRGGDAVLHLFRVASSLDSLVVGEPQILGQVKDAIRMAADAGSLGPVLHRVTQRALWVAKQVRSRTEIGRHHVGVGNVAVSLARQIFSTLRGRRALLVGVGEMGRQVAAAMVGAGIEELVVANRTFARAVAAAEEFGGTAIPWERMHEYVARVDVVITATGAARPILGPEDVRAAMKARRHQPLFLVDLAVPRNIDPAVDKLDQAFLFNVDDLTQVADRGRELREQASVQAEQLVRADAEAFSRRLSAFQVHADIGRMVRHAEAMRQIELGRSSRWLAGLTEEQREGADALTRALVKRLLDRPIRVVREVASMGDQDRVDALLAAWAGEAGEHGEVGMNAEDGKGPP